MKAVFPGAIGEGVVCVGLTKTLSPQTTTIMVNLTDLRNNCEVYDD